MKFIIKIFFTISISFNYSQINIESNFELPSGFYRPYNDDYSKFLRTFPLKANNKVFYYNGDEKPNNSVYAAVFDYKIGNKNLHQCADASIYLNARFKYDNNKLEEIAYSFTSGYLFKYKNYLNGINPKPYQNSQGRWLVKEEQAEKRVNNYKTFFKYLETLWTWAGTLSVNNLDTKSIDIEEIRPGDIFIKGGSPGHSVSVVDVIQNSNGRVLFMLSQSFMPAQEQHILLNQETGDVWYELFLADVVQTPEWITPFSYSDVKRFK